MENYIDFFKELQKNYDTGIDFEKAFKEGFFKIEENGNKKGELCRLVMTDKCVELDYESHKAFHEFNEKYKSAKDDKEKEKLHKELDKLIGNEDFFMASFFNREMKSMFFSLTCGKIKFKKLIDECLHEGFTEEHLIIKKAGKYTIGVSKPWWHEKKTKLDLKLE